MAKKHVFPTSINYGTIVKHLLKGNKFLTCAKYWVGLATIYWKDKIFTVHFSPLVRKFTYLLYLTDFLINVLIIKAIFHFCDYLPFSTFYTVQVYKHKLRNKLFEITIKKKI